MGILSRPLNKLRRPKQTKRIETADERIDRIEKEIAEELKRIRARKKKR